MCKGGSKEQEQTQRRNQANVVKIMMYIFPRQFGMHNVFTSEVDWKRTAQRSHDYTLREEEISSLQQDASGDSRHPKIPKRLRGTVRHLVERIQVLHQRCSYVELLKHYCPSPFDVCLQQQHRNPAPNHEVPSTTPDGLQRPSRSQRPQVQKRSRAKKKYRRTQSQAQPVEAPKCSIVELACATARVSAFCQAVLSKIIPNAFWGEGEAQSHNKRMILRKVDHFIRLRRYETMSLHEIVQDLKVSAIAAILWMDTLSDRSLGCRYSLATAASLAGTKDKPNRYQQAI